MDYIINVICMQEGSGLVCGQTGLYKNIFKCSQWTKVFKNANIEGKESPKLQLQPKSVVVCLLPPRFNATSENILCSRSVLPLGNVTNLPVCHYLWEFVSEEHLFCGTVDKSVHRAADGTHGGVGLDEALLQDSGFLPTTGHTQTLQLTQLMAQHVSQRTHSANRTYTPRSQWRVKGSI